MLYKEAYELIDIVLEGQNPLVPLSGKLKQRFFADAVKMMSRQYVRSIKEEVFTGDSSTKKYIFQNENAGDRIYQIQFKSTDGASATYTDIPFLPQSLVTNPDEVNIPSYVVRKESSNGIWTSLNQRSKTVTTSENHNLSIGDYVKLYDTGISDLEYDNGIVKRLKITAVTSNTFTVDATFSNTSTISSKKSPYQKQQVELTLTKATGAGTITVRYYADPNEGHNYQDVIDLDDTLCKASVYCAIKELMALDGSIDISKQMNEIVTMY